MNTGRQVVYRCVFSVIFGFLLTSCGEDKQKYNRADSDALIPASKEKILYIDSYDLDFPWIQGITGGILDVLNITMDSGQNLDNRQSPYELRIIHMNSKNNPSRESIENAAMEALAEIEEWNPDVIITSDDNASKYLVVPYLMESEIPIVFCGVNWDASVYGFPSQNITGMIEVNLIDKMIDELKKYSGGNRIGYIRDDATTSRKESENYEKLLGMPLEKRFPSSFIQWKNAFLSLQEYSNIILVGYPNALADWDGNTEPYEIFLRENTKVPTGSWDDWTSGWVLMTFALDAEEQGVYAATTAIQILNGETPGNIPVVRNKKAKVFLNMAIARKLGIVFPMELVDRAHLVNPE